jgi:hypothetical protein
MENHHDIPDSFHVAEKVHAGDVEVLSAAYVSDFIAKQMLVVSTVMYARHV